MYLDLRATLHDGRVTVTMKLWGCLKLIWRLYHGNRNLILNALNLQCEVPPNQLRFREPWRYRRSTKKSTLCTQNQAWSTRKEKCSMMSWVCGCYVVHFALFSDFCWLGLHLCFISKSTMKHQQIRLKIGRILNSVMLIGSAHLLIPSLNT